MTFSPNSIRAARRSQETQAASGEDVASVVPNYKIDKNQRLKKKAPVRRPGHICRAGNNCRAQAPEWDDSSSNSHPTLAFCFEHDLFGKPVPTFPDQAQEAEGPAG